MQPDACGKAFNEELKFATKIMNLCQEYGIDHTLYPLDTRSSRFKYEPGKKIYQEYDAMRGSIHDVNQLNKHMNDTKEVLDLNTKFYEEILRSIASIGVDPNAWDITYISMRGDDNVESLVHKDALCEGWPILTIPMYVPRTKKYSFSCGDLKCDDLRVGHYYSILSTAYVHHGHKYCIQNRKNKKNNDNDDQDADLKNDDNDDEENVWRILIGALPKDKKLLKTFIDQALFYEYGVDGSPPPDYTGQKLGTKNCTMKQFRRSLLSYAARMKHKKDKQKKDKINKKMATIRAIKAEKEKKRKEAIADAAVDDDNDDNDNNDNDNNDNEKNTKTKRLHKGITRTTTVDYDNDNEKNTKTKRLHKGMTRTTAVDDEDYDNDDEDIDDNDDEDIGDNDDNDNNDNGKNTEEEDEEMKELEDLIVDDPVE